jgi:transposase
MTDELRDFGFSKDCKFNEVQVVMGMIIDSDGIPVGYELFPGNTFDGKTLVSALSNIKKRFGIKRVIIVADRGINSKGNLKLIKEAGYGYIIASKIKGMGKEKVEKILEPSGFEIILDNQGEEVFRYKTLEHDNVFDDDEGEKHTLVENLVITYSPARAKKDAKDRERLIEKAKKLLESPEKIKSSNKRGGKKYIEAKEPEASSWELATAKIEQDARFDGYYGIQTSEKTMAVTDIIDAHHTLWKIEESFRIMKSTLELRPVFHWTPKRIKGHFMVCFLAFLMERKMEILLKDEQKNEIDDVVSSPQRIQEALNTMQIVEVAINGESHYIKAVSAPLAQKIFKRLGLSMPANISNKSDLYARLQFESHDETLQLTFL